MSLYLQAGQRAKAEQTLRTFQDMLARQNAPFVRSGYLTTLLPYLRETGACESMEQLLAPLAQPAQLTAEEQRAACHPAAASAPPGLSEELEMVSLRA